MKPTLQPSTPGPGAALAAPRLPPVPRVPPAVLRMLPDDRLVAMVRTGSEPAFEAIFDRHHRTVLAFCRHMVGSPEEAEDAVQHTFLAAYRQLRHAPGPIHLRPWLYTVARNRCLSMLRARRERPLEDGEEPATENLAAAVQQREDLRDLLRDLTSLPDDQRAALVLSELGAASHQEIGEILGCPRTKVKALVFQARTSLAATRRARDTPCADIREEIAVPHGGGLRRTTVHRHLRECPGCREFREEVRGQRRALGALLPVVPTLALREAVLAAVSGSAAAGGAVTAGGAALTAGGGTVAAKVLVGLAVAGGGTAAGVEAVRHVNPPQGRERAGAESARTEERGSGRGATVAIAAVSGAAAAQGGDAAPAAGGAAAPGVPREVAGPHGGVIAFNTTGASVGMAGRGAAADAFDDAGASPPAGPAGPAGVEPAPPAAPAVAMVDDFDDSGDEESSERREDDDGDDHAAGTSGSHHDDDHGDDDDDRRDDDDHGSSSSNSSSNSNSTRGRARTTITTATAGARARRPRTASRSSGKARRDKRQLRQGRQRQLRQRAQRPRAPARPRPAAAARAQRARVRARAGPGSRAGRRVAASRHRVQRLGLGLGRRDGRGRR